MLRTIGRVVIPLSVRVSHLDFRVVRGIARWERGYELSSLSGMLTTHPSLVVQLSEQGIQTTMPTALLAYSVLLQLLQPKLVQVLNQQEGRNMSMAITDEMHLSYEDFVKLKEHENVTIIDVRNPHELQESGKIEGSINIPLKELRFALEHLSTEEFQYKYGIARPKLDEPLIFHCKAGGRSLQALQIALELGYKNAKHYKGGFSDWLEHNP